MSQHGDWHWSKGRTIEVLGAQMRCFVQWHYHGIRWSDDDEAPKYEKLNVNTRVIFCKGPTSLSETCLCCSDEF
jgi:hypothetical protein